MPRCAVDVVVAVLQQLLDDVLDVFADVARFGQRGGVGDDEWHVQQTVPTSGPAGSCRPPGRADQQDVALGELDLVLAAGPMCFRRL